MGKGEGCPKGGGEQKCPEVLVCIGRALDQ